MDTAEQVAMIDAMIVHLRRRRRELVGQQPVKPRNPARWQAIANAYMAGKKINDIAAEFRTDRGVVVRVARESGLTGQRKPGRPRIAA